MKKLNGGGKIVNGSFFIMESNLSINVKINGEFFAYHGLISDYATKNVILNENDSNDEILSFLNKINDYIIFKYNQNKEEFQKMKIFFENNLG